MNASRKTLGRGLGDLMVEVSQGEKPLSASSDRAFLQLPIEGIYEDGSATLQTKDAPPETLLQSLRTHGVLQPILARKQERGYVVIDGRKRLRAARELGMKTIPALILNNLEADATLLAAEANRRPVEIQPIPVPAATQPERDIGALPAAGRNEGVPAPALVRQSEWRILIVFAAATVAALLFGIAGTLWFMNVVPTPSADHAAVERVPRGVGSASPKTAAAGAPDKAVVPSVAPLAPEPGAPPEWANKLAVNGARVIQTNAAVAITFDRPVFTRYVALAPEAGEVLDELAAALNASGASLRVRVCGHTDDAPVRAGGPYRDNYAVGLARAVEVVEYLRHEGGLTNAEFAAFSAGESDPPYSNDSPEGRLKNRTVTMEVAERSERP
jgi:outer membrane protein OmpA-like peptidoglycan-associated protein